MVSTHCVRSASTTQASRPPGRVMVRGSTASRAPPGGRDPERQRRQSCASRASRRRATARGRRVASTAGRPPGRCVPSPVGREGRRTRVARDRFGFRRSTRPWRCASRGGASSCALPCSTPEAAACRLARQHGFRQASSRSPSRVRNRSPCGRAAFGALPCREGGRGGRSFLVGPCCLCRLRLPVRPFPVCTALPSPRTLRGSDALAVLTLPCGGASLGLAPQAPSGPPTCLTPLSTPPTRLVDPDRPSGSAPQRFRCVGFWSVQTIAVCLRRENGAVSRCRECGRPDGLRGALWTLHLCRSACTSCTDAPLGRSGW